jgi:hypothetical protein
VAERPLTVFVKVVDAPGLSPSTLRTMEPFAAALRSTIGRNSFADLLKIIE